MENTANHKNTGRTFVQMFIFITGNVVYVMDFILYLCIMSKCFLMEEEIYCGSICMIFVHYVN